MKISKYIAGFMLVAQLGAYCAGESLKICSFKQDNTYGPGWRITATNTVPGNFYWVQKKEKLTDSWKDDYGEKQAETNSLEFIVQNDGTNKFFRVMGDAE